MEVELEHGDHELHHLLRVVGEVLLQLPANTTGQLIYCQSTRASSVFYYLIFTVFTMRYNAPQTALCEGPGQRFEPETGDIKDTDHKTRHISRAGGWQPVIRSLPVNSEQTDLPPTRPGEGSG